MSFFNSFPIEYNYPNFNVIWAYAPNQPLPNLEFQHFPLLFPNYMPQASAYYKYYFSNSDQLDKLFVSRSGLEEAVRQRREQITENNVNIHRNSLTKMNLNESNLCDKNCLESNKNDRNIYSNCIKLFLKFIRSEESFGKELIQKCIKKVQIPYKIEQFIQDLNYQLKPEMNYIRPTLFKEIIIRQNSHLATVLRVLFRQFFSYRVHYMASRTVRTSKLVRREQVRAGRKLLSYIFDEEKKESA